MRQTGARARERERERSEREKRERARARERESTRARARERESPHAWPVDRRVADEVRAHARGNKARHSNEKGHDHTRQRVPLAQIRVQRRVQIPAQTTTDSQRHTAVHRRVVAVVERPDAFPEAVSRHERIGHDNEDPPEQRVRNLVVPIKARCQQPKWYRIPIQSSSEQKSQHLEKQSNQYRISILNR